MLMDGRIRMAVQRKTVAQPPLREIEHIVEQSRHALCTVADVAANVVQRFLIRSSPQQHVDDCINRPASGLRRS